MTRKDNKSLNKMIRISGDFNKFIETNRMYKRETKCEILQRITGFGNE